MPARTCLILVLSLTCSVPAAWAQTSPLEARMGSAQFRTSGLHRLEPSELRALESWLASQAPAETQLSEAREAGRREAERATAPSAEPVRSTLVGRFEGFSRGREYTLANGQVWRQIGEAPLVGGRVESPTVEIEPARISGWWLRVEGFNARVRVERVR
ncbi:MAG: hypothetical protein ACTIJY_06695 [Luteimonas sp.]